MKRYALGLAILALLAANVAYAQLGGPATPRAGLWEYSLKTVYTPSLDIDGDYGTSVTINDDLGWGFGFGYFVSDQFNTGISLAWRSIPYDATIVDADDENNTSRYSNWLDMANVSLFGEYSFMPSRVTPYASGQVGWMLLDTNIETGTDEYVCWYDPWFGYVCAYDELTYGTDALTWSLGAGLRIELAPRVSLRVGYEYGWADIDGFDGTDMFRVDLGVLQ